jgi:hypothetical protein
MVLLKVVLQSEDGLQPPILIYINVLQTTETVCIASCPWTPIPVFPWA